MAAASHTLGRLLQNTPFDVLQRLRESGAPPPSSLAPSLLTAGPNVGTPGRQLCIALAI